MTLQQLIDKYNKPPYNTPIKDIEEVYNEQRATSICPSCSHVQADVPAHAGA